MSTQILELLLADRTHAPSRRCSWTGNSGSGHDAFTTTFNVELTILNDVRLFMHFQARLRVFDVDEVVVEIYLLAKRKETQ